MSSKSKSAPKSRHRLTAANADKYELYQKAVQSAEEMAEIANQLVR